MGDLTGALRQNRGRVGYRHRQRYTQTGPAARLPIGSHWPKLPRELQRARLFVSLCRSSISRVGQGSAELVWPVTLFVSYFNVATDPCFDYRALQNWCGRCRNSSYGSTWRLVLD